MRAPKATAALFVLSAGALLLAAQCRGGMTVVQEFELPACPAEAFSLPAVVDRPPFKLAAGGPKHDVPVCPGFTLYHLKERGYRGFYSERGYYYVQLNRSRSCSLSVSYTYESGGPGPDKQIEERTTPWAQVVAELAMNGSDVAPTIPAVKTERLHWQSEVQEWCARRGDTTR
jgi:hypothetical protein